MAALSAAAAAVAVYYTQHKTELSSDLLSRMVIFAAGAAVSSWTAAFVVRWLLASYSSFGDVLPRWLSSSVGRQAVKGATVILTAGVSVTSAAVTVYIAAVPGTPVWWRPLFDHFQAIAAGLLADFILDWAAAAAKTFLENKILASRRKYLDETRANLIQRHGQRPPTAATGGKDDAAATGGFEPFGGHYADDDSAESDDAGDSFVLKFQSTSSEEDDDASSRGGSRGTQRKMKKVSLASPRQHQQYQPFDDDDNESDDGFGPVKQPSSDVETGGRRQHDVLLARPFEMSSSADDGEDVYREQQFDSIHPSPMANDKRSSHGLLDEMSSVDSDGQFEEVEDAAAGTAFDTPWRPSNAAVVVPPAPTQAHRGISLAAIAGEVIRQQQQSPFSLGGHRLYEQFRLGARSFRHTSRPEPLVSIPPPPLPPDEVHDPLRDGADPAAPGHAGGDSQSRLPHRQRGEGSSFIIDVEMQQSEGSTSSSARTELPSPTNSDERHQQHRTQHQPTAHAFEGAATLSRRNLRVAQELHAASHNPLDFDFVAAQRYE
jgi:hypothetical protein